MKEENKLCDKIKIEFKFMDEIKKKLWVIVKKYK